MIKPLMRNKKGNAFGIVVFFVILFSVMVIGFFLALAFAVISIGSDEVTDVVQDLGVVSGTNISAVAEYTIVPFNDVAQNLGMLLAVGYLMALLSTIVFVVAYRQTQSLIYVGLYFGLMMLLILGAIIISNAYEEIYSGTDDIATELRSNTTMSYLILYSPHIFTTIGFIAGVYMFAGKKDEVEL